MIRIEVQNENQANALAVGLQHSINAQSQYLTECSSKDVSQETETFVWLRDSYSKLEKKYSDPVVKDS